ncbi:hypothetical protein HK405_013936, partial [Cladochytrium tenue]
MPNVHVVDLNIDMMPYLSWSEHALELFTDMKDTDVARFRWPTSRCCTLALARLAWCYVSIMYSVQNHNGMPVYTSKAAGKIDFYRLQVLTCRDVTPTSDWLMGGLNYQIEHHM